MMNKIFVVNLERCKEKNKRMKDRLGNINYKMIKAVDGENLTREKLINMDGDILKDWKDPYSGRNITWGEVGCTLSHCNIYKKCLMENIDNAIIFEDDVLLKDDFQKRKRIYQKRWEIYYTRSLSEINMKVSSKEIVKLRAELNSNKNVAVFFTTNYFRALLTLTSYLL